MTGERAKGRGSPKRGRERRRSSPTGRVTNPGSAGSGDMFQSVYDPAGISAQLVGLLATQTLSNKTLVTPTIASLINAQHDHLNGSGGGVLPGFTYAWITGNSSVVHTITTSFTTLPLSTIQETNGPAFSIASNEITPPSDGTYEITTATAWDADITDEADLVELRWQVWNSVGGSWETIAGHL